MSNQESQTAPTEVWVPERIELPEGFGSDIPEELSAEDIVRLKDRLRGEDLESERDRAQVCGAICLYSFTERAYTDKEDVEAGDRDPSDVWFRNPQEFTIAVAGLTSSWNASLGRALELPGAEWPEYMTPPSTFAWGEALLKHLEQQWEERS